MEIEIWKEILSNIRPKLSLQLIANDNKTRIRMRFNPPLEIDKNKKYEMALVNLETYYSFPNITSENNHFMYKENERGWFSIVLPEGCYELADINNVLQREMRVNGHWNSSLDEYPIALGANSSTLKSTLKIKDGYTVKFQEVGSFKKLLGFTGVDYESGYHEGEATVNIMNVNSIFVNIDIIGGSYVNGNRHPTIYSFFPNVSPGHKIIENPQNLVYLPVILDTISSIETSITDDSGKLLNLRGETVNIRYHLREA